MGPDDFGRMLRQRNIFGGGGGDQRTPFNNVSFMPRREDKFAPPPQMPAPQQEGPSTGAYRKFLESPDPQRSDYAHPGKMARLSAMLTGVAAGSQGKDGYGAAKMQLDQPYQQAMEERTAQRDKFATAADLEQKTAATALDNRQEQERLDIARENSKSLAGSRESMNLSRERTRDLAEKVASNTATPEETQEYKIELEKLRQTGQLANTAAQGQNNLDLEAQRQEGRIEIQKLQDQNKDKKLYAVPGGNIILVGDDGTVIDTKRPSGLFDRQQITDMNNEAAKSLKASPGASNTSTRTQSYVDPKNPDAGITTETTNKSVAAPMDIRLPNSQNQKVNLSGIGGDGKLPVPQARPAPELSGNKVTMIGTDGKRYQVAEEEVEEAIANRWKVVE